MKRFAAHLGAVERVIVERTEDGYLVGDRYIAAEVDELALPVLLADRPQFLIQVLRGSRRRLALEMGCVVASDARTLATALGDKPSTVDGKVTGVLVDDGLLTYRAVLSDNGVSWFNDGFLRMFDIESGMTVKVGGSRDPLVARPFDHPNIRRIYIMPVAMGTAVEQVAIVADAMLSKQHGVVVP